jgi:TRAP-type C4-dicarboxylate transport system substrate-binding protein
MGGTLGKARELIRDLQAGRSDIMVIGQYFISSLQGEPALFSQPDNTHRCAMSGVKL